MPNWEVGYYLVLAFELTSQVLPRSSISCCFFRVTLTTHIKKRPKRGRDRRREEAQKNLVGLTLSNTFHFLDLGLKVTLLLFELLPYHNGIISQVFRSPNWSSAFEGKTSSERPPSLLTSSLFFSSPYLLPQVGPLGSLLVKSLELAVLSSVFLLQTLDLDVLIGSSQWWGRRFWASPGTAPRLS